MHKITKGLKKKKKGKKSKHKDEELFKPEELEAYRREHQLQSTEAAENVEPAVPVDNEEWKKFNALTAGIDNVLKKTQGDLDRIKSTSFFQRVPLASELKKKEEAEAAQREADIHQEKPKPISATEAAIVPVSESESEYEEEDDIFDTTYIDVIAAGDVKLAYIPESPTDEPEGDDPFDTSIAERAILGPSVARKGKKLVPIGAAVEILTGRVQAPTCVPTKRPVSRRQILKEKDLLLGSFDCANSTLTAVEADSPQLTKSSLLDDDAPPDLANEPIDLSKNLQQIATPVTDAIQEQSRPINLLDEFDVIGKCEVDFNEDENDEFALLAAESLSKKPSIHTLTPINATAVNSKESWNAFGDEKSEVSNVSDGEDYGDDPFDTTFADNILPGKAELKIIENEILNNFEDDVDFNPRAQDSYIDIVKHTVSIQLTNPTGQRESISSLDRISESDLDIIKPSHRDLLGGSNTDLSNLTDLPLQPDDSIDENYIEYCDPFDTSLVQSAKLPGQTELKFLERELLGDRNDDDDDFNPRGGELVKEEPEYVYQNRKVSFDLPLEHRRDFLGAGVEDKVSNPLTPYYVRENSISEVDDNADPFDTSFVSHSTPGKAELRIIEKELFKPCADNLDDPDFNPRDEKQVAVAKVVQIINEIADPGLRSHKPIGLPIEETPIDLLAIDNNVTTKVLTPAAEESADFASSYCDPFDTSIANNIFPGKTELKLLENEFINSVDQGDLTDSEFDPRRENIFDERSASVNVKTLTPIIGNKGGFEIEEDDDIDPFDTSIASNIGPRSAELKLLESELI